MPAMLAKWITIFDTALGTLGAVMIHAMTFLINRDPIFTNVKGVLVFFFYTPLFIEVNEWRNAVAVTVFVVMQGIMSSVKYKDWRYREII